MVAYSFKKRFVIPIRVGLGLPPTTEEFAAGLDDFGNVHRALPKRQTIRANRRRHVRPGESIQLYCAMRTSSCFKIGDAVCTSIEPIVFWISLHRMSLGKGLPWISDEFAQADGFRHANDMHNFWISEHGVRPFEGVIIKWRPAT
jgi:hypothetical protein